MKKRDLIKRISAGAKAQDVDWTFVREGANHEVWSLDGITIPIPRHNEINEMTARSICKDCEEKLGEGWWK